MGLSIGLGTTGAPQSLDFPDITRGHRPDEVHRTKRPWQKPVLPKSSAAREAKPCPDDFTGFMSGSRKAAGWATAPPA